MDILVLFAIGHEPDLEYLNQKAKDFEINIVYEDILDPVKHNGFYTLNFNRERSGFEIYNVDYKEFMQSAPEPPGGFPDDAVVYLFNFGHSHKEPASAFYTAAIFSTLEGANVLETQSGEYLNTEQLLEAGRVMENEL